MNKLNSFKHHLLIAMPSLKDSNFNKAVIYLYEHTDNGAMGLIINKPLPIKLGKVLEHLNIEVTDKLVSKKPVLMGGPVGKEQGFVLHEDQNEQVILSASKELLCEIAAGKGPQHYLIALGYAGWDSGQLENELSRNDWLVAPFDSSVIFSAELNQRWELAAKLIGIDINRLSGQVGHA